MTPPTSMRAMLIGRFGGPEELHLGEVPIPRPEAGEVLIKVAFAGVNPADWKCREGRLAAYFAYRFPFILGFAAAGVVVAVGAGVADFAPGDAVLTSSNQGRGEWGSYAEYLKSAVATVAHVPGNLGFAQAATIPTAGTTTWGAVHDLGAVRAGQRLLINGGAGSVGSFAIQLAKRAGAAVAATCGPDNLDFVKGFGADCVINYSAGGVAEAVAAWAPEGVDLIVDAVGLGSLPAAAAKLIRRGGALVAIETLNRDVEVFDRQLAAERNVRLLSNMQAVARIAEHLQAIVGAVAEGGVQTPPFEVLALEQAPEA